MQFIFFCWRYFDKTLTTTAYFQTRTLGPVECDLPCSSNSLKPALFSPATSQLNFVSCNGAGMAQQSETDGIASEVYNWLPKVKQYCA